jgi:predicted RNA-binding Zn ribbon-like protein
MSTTIDDIPDSELRFHFEGGRRCLDLVATVGERWRRSFERLREPADLARWLVEAGLANREPPVRERQLSEARRLREAIYRVAKLAGGGTPDRADLETINAAARRPPLMPRLEPDGEVTTSAEQPVEAALSTVARDAIDLFTGPYASRIRQCAADDCALMFVDTSRPGHRRWCSMEGCGNRAKTAAYRRRVRSKSGR